MIVKVCVPIALTGAALGLALPAAASGSPATPAPTAPAARAPAMVAPLAAALPRAAQAAAAASTCARYAAAAGWANNGYFSGDLVTATAVCVAESAGDPLRYVCDENGKVVGQGDYSGDPVPCPAGTTSYDRGLWQLNSVAASGTSDACAFAAACNAGAAYLASQRGTTFAPWSSYDSDAYARYIDAAQSAVTTLTKGAVTSALLGECLQAASKAGARVVVANCGPGGTIQQWTVTGGQLRSGSLCAAISSTSASAPGIVLRRCANQKIQKWTVAGRDELRNGYDGACLTDPGSSLTGGTQVVASRCSAAKNQTWWLP
ncbi:MAG TPA: ricin-type beta-trefoil lectin domain protein [Streptosporangiaceae bacterium]